MHFYLFFIFFEPGAICILCPLLIYGLATVGPSQASLYVNVASAAFSIQAADVIASHNMPIKAGARTPTQSDPFLRCCAFICFSPKLTRSIGERRRADNVSPAFFFFCVQILKRSCTEILSVEPSSVCVNGERVSTQVDSVAPPAKLGKNSAWHT